MLRNSGAELKQVYMKTGEGMREQGAFMMDRPGYLQPLALLEDGYLLPVAQPLPYNLRPHELWRLLQTAWNGPLPNAPVTMSMHGYWDYVQALTMPDWLRSDINGFDDPAIESQGTWVNAIHGDLTTENILLHDGKLVLIDPNLRPVPRIMEMDTSKILISYMGYGALRKGHAEPLGIDSFFAEQFRNPLVRWLALTHIARMWRYQEKHHLLLGTIAKRILNGGL